jgi:uncharacterized protein (DUF983 family)
MLVSGAAVLLVAFIIEIKYQPALWVHIVVGLAVILITSWWSLRLFKTLLLALHYRYRKKEIENG